MPRQTKADRIRELEASVSHWMTKCNEVIRERQANSERCDREIANESRMRQNAEWGLQEARNLWNKWVEAERNPEGDLATIRFPKDVFNQLLTILKP